ncbi:YcnI family copper-binding membrane protein [Mycolicibacterium sphagni]|uniref:YcnI family copper-binding membrane protein n=1 Tax=Mycolicibacterium sphagni TaxID=1786 RepID=UPI0021F2F348|nr:YcnI family protein [Mycolicibacterium sphagni]MCV7176998.1 YcnI family protein [Mycolicibacterium sphagni]
MTNIQRRNTRISQIGGIVTALAITAVVAAAPAWAHVHVTSDHAAPGQSAVLTFMVPNESEKGSLTTELNIVLPNLTGVNTEQLPGWTARLDRDLAAGTVKSITWTAAPGAGIPADEFALFRVSVVLPKADSVSFPATQTYADGTVVRWDEPTPPGGAEPENPVPTLSLTAAPDAMEHPGQPSPTVAAQAAPASDDTARWLAGAALVVAAVGVALAVVSRRRA